MSSTRYGFLGDYDIPLVVRETPAQIQARYIITSFFAIVCLFLIWQFHKDSARKNRINMAKKMDLLYTIQPDYKNTMIYAKKIRILTDTSEIKNIVLIDTLGKVSTPKTKRSKYGSRYLYIMDFGRIVEISEIIITSRQTAPATIEILLDNVVWRRNVLLTRPETQIYITQPGTFAPKKTGRPCSEKCKCSYPLNDTLNISIEDETISFNR
jgi:hypothetical protein